VTWIGGVFFFDEHNQGEVEITFYPAVQIRPFARNGVKAGAVFGQATYSLTRRLSVTGGVRYTNEQKDLANTGGRYQPGTAILVDPTTFYDYVDDATYQAWTPKSSMQMQVSSDTFVYFSATRGFKSGGFNQFDPGAPESERVFSPEFAWSFEGGLKRTMAGGRARVNTAVFFNDYRDLQVQSFLRPAVIHISNAGSATIRGIEVEAAVEAARGLLLAAHVSWLDATYDRYLVRGPGDSTSDAAGHRLNNAPEWSGSGSAVYDFALGRAGTASVRGDVTRQSRVFFTPANDAIETQHAYGLLHLRAGFEPRNRRWEIAVYVRNLGNQGYITGTANVPLPAITGRPGEPRHWGTQFTIRR
jgi:iron complex outermembrane receptor protein